MGAERSGDQSHAWGASSLIGTLAIMTRTNEAPPPPPLPTEEVHVPTEVRWRLRRDILQSGANVGPGKAPCREPGRSCLQARGSAGPAVPRSCFPVAGTPAGASRPVSATGDRPADEHIRRCPLASIPILDFESTPSALPGLATLLSKVPVINAL